MIIKYILKFKLKTLPVSPAPIEHVDQQEFFPISEPIRKNIMLERGEGGGGKVGYDRTFHILTFK